MHVLPQVLPTSEKPATIPCDVLVIGAFSTGERAEIAHSGVLDSGFRAMLDDALADASFGGRLGDVFIAPTFERAAARAVLVTGLGEAEHISDTVIRRAAAAAARGGADRPAVVSLLHTVGGSNAVRAAVEGFLLALYRFEGARSKPRLAKVQRLLLPDSDEVAIERGLVGVRATALARDLVNEPAATLTPRVLAARAKETADASGLECTVFEVNELVERGFGGVLGVGRGSSESPCFIHLRYEPESFQGSVALVGKGVTFDSGGLSLKDRHQMERMKTDMAGAAAVIGTMSAVARLRPGLRVDAYIPSVENMPGSHAIRPGDVVRHYGGRTVEVLNTDAEGRLILADALAYASERSPDAIIDAATLTGTMGLALGRKCSGYFATDDALAGELEDAARTAGEKVWRMPLIEEYHSELDSPLADAKNVGVRFGGAIIAALFLRDFVGQGIPWVHLDIAGTARADADYDEVTRGGTGAITRTLINWVERRGR